MIRANGTPVSSRTTRHGCRRLSGRIAIGVAGLLGILLASVGCAPMLGTGAGEAAPITVQFASANEGSRTLMPDMSGLHMGGLITHYQVFLQRNSSDPDHASYPSLDTTILPISSLPTPTFSNVVTGPWDISVIGYDNGTMVASGSLSNVTVTEAGPNEFTVALDPYQSTTGDFSLDYTFPAGEIDGLTIELVGPDPVVTTTTYTEASPEIIFDGATGSATGTFTLDSGFYLLTTSFESSTVGRPKAVTMERVHIYDNQTTEHLLVLAPSDLSAPPLAPLGAQVKEIEPGLLQVSWNDESDTETGFEIIHSDDSGFATFDGPISVSANTTRYEITGVPTSAYRYVRVTAVNDYGSSSFTAASTRVGEIPYVFSSTPSDGATNWASDAYVDVQFFNSMDPLVTEQAIYVVESGSPIDVTRSWPSQSTIRLTPSSGRWPRFYGEYTVVVTADVRSESGYRGAADETIVFTTAGPVGEPDPSFDGDGFATLQDVSGFAGPDWAESISFGRDGRLLVSGRTIPSGNDVMFVSAVDSLSGARLFDVLEQNAGMNYSATATVHTAFDQWITLGMAEGKPSLRAHDSDGVSLPIFASGTSPIVSLYDPLGNDVTTTDLVVTGDGQRVYSATNNQVLGEASIFAHQYDHLAGQADVAATFASGDVTLPSGPVTSGVTEIHALALNPAEDVVYAVGVNHNGTDDDMVVCAFEYVTGAWHTTFGVNGLLRVDVGGNEGGFGITVDAAGNLYVVGVSDSGGYPVATVWKFDAAGTADAAFAGGSLQLPFLATPAVVPQSAALSIALDAAGNAVIGGYVEGDGSLVPAADQRGAIWRVLPTGVLDTSFNAAVVDSDTAGGRGYSPAAPSIINDVVIGPNQAIYAAGVSGIGVGGQDAFVLKLQ